MTMSLNSLRLVRPFSTSLALETLMLAAVVTGLPVLAHLVSPTLGIAICLILGTLVANFAAPMLPPILVFSYLFQNLFVSLASPQIVQLSDFNAIRGYNFLLTATAWLVIIIHYWTGRASFDGKFRTVMNVSFWALGLIGLYFVIGLQSNLMSAVIYLRNIVVPLMLFNIFAVVGLRFKLTIHTAFLAMAYALVAYCYAELFFQEPLLKLVNGDVYLRLGFQEWHDAGVWVKQMQDTGRVARSDLDALETGFLNTPFLADLGIKLTRLQGPNFQSVSCAYAIGFFSLILAGTGGFVYWLLSLPLLFIIGSKGALAMVLFAMTGFAASRLVGGRWLFWPYVASLVGYAVAGIMIGMQAGDFHVIGFLAGFDEFLRNPLGHGLGVGGNLSVNHALIDWGRSQQLGHTDAPVESAVGVMLSQMGLAGVAVLACVAWIGWRAWALYLQVHDSLLGIAALALMIVLFNGIFQESALFSPLALGLIMALTGLMVGRAFRQKASG
jgi:hypothetical protein